MSVELPTPNEFYSARELLEAFVRDHVDVFGAHVLDEDDDDLGLAEGQVLCDWLLISHWIGTDGEHRYSRVASAMSPHSRAGLERMFDD